MRWRSAVAGGVVVLCAVVGCGPSRRAILPPVHPSASPPVPPSPPPPVPILPSRAELTQELATVSSPQTSLAGATQSADSVMRVGASWVRFGPKRGTLKRSIIENGKRPYVPFTARILVTYTQGYSDASPTQAQAAHAALALALEQTTTYRYEYLTGPGQSGMWAFKDRKDGPVIDKGRQPAGRGD